MRKVTKYESNDGSLHDTEEEATQNDIILILIQRLPLLDREFARLDAGMSLLRHAVAQPEFRWNWAKATPLEGS